MALPIAGPPDSVTAPPPMPPLPLLGIAPPPVGPRLPNPAAIEKLKRGTDQLAEAATLDPVLVQPRLEKIIEALTAIRFDLQRPPRPPRLPREEDDEESEPLDQTPGGDVRGTPMADVLPRLMAAGMR